VEVGVVVVPVSVAITVVVVVDVLVEVTVVVDVFVEVTVVVTVSPLQPIAGVRINIRLAAIDMIFTNLPFIV
jgi:hypothetical protein